MHFAQHFAKVCTSNTSLGAARLKDKYMKLRADYTVTECDDNRSCYAELVESVIRKMKCGKAAGLDGITAEHLKYCNAILPCVLSKLFNIMLANSHALSGFGESYTVPLLKNNCSIYSKTLTVDDFRGVSISPVLSKVFEHCILDKYSHLFATSDNQFGFTVSDILVVPMLYTLSDVWLTIMQRCCKYPSHKYKYKYKCKYLKLSIKYNTSTGTSMSLIKNQTAPALNEYRSVSYYITIYMDFTSLQYCCCYCLFRDKLTVG